MTALLLDPPSTPIGTVTLTRGGALSVGQSNAGFFNGGGLSRLNDALAQIWGVPRAVYDFYGWRGPDGWALTQGAVENCWSTYGGTPLYNPGEDGPFLSDNGGDPSTWTAGYAGRGVEGFVTGFLSAADRADIPFIWWLHTESDSQLRSFGNKATYKAAVVRWCQLLRLWVGKSAAALPILTALPIPYGPSNAAAHRMIREVFHELATDPALNFHVALRNTADAEPRDGTDTSHVDDVDLFMWSRRLGLTAGRIMHGLYGAGPEADYGGLGPRIVHAWAESATTTIITVQPDRSASLKFRHDKARDGRGWSITDGGIPRTVTGAEIIASNKVRVQHFACTNSFALRTIGYCLNGERCGRDGLIYDDNSSLPPPAGLSADWAVDLPIAGTFLALQASEFSEPVGDAFQIVIDPEGPGTLQAGPDGIARWQTTIRTINGDAVEWTVHDLDDRAYGEYGLLLGTSTAQPLEVPFQRNGDYLLLRWPGDDSRQGWSFRVNIEPFVAESFDIILDPEDPGELALGPEGRANWPIVIRTPNGDSVEWAVFNGTSQSRTPWLLLEGTREGAYLGVPLWETGDYLQARKPGDDGFKVYSRQCVIVGGNGWRGSAVAVASTGGAAELTPKPGGHYIVINPRDPGTLFETEPGAGAVWEVEILASGVARIGFVVAKSSNFEWYGNAEMVDMPPSGRLMIYPRIRMTADYLKVFDAANFDIKDDSLAATLAVRLPDGGVRMLAVEPRDPGIVYETQLGAGAPFTFTIKSSGMARVAWAVARPDDSWRGAATIIDATGADVVTARMIASGDRIKVLDGDDFGFNTDTLACTVALDPASGAPLDPADVAFAKAWTKTLYAGLDIERWYAWALPGGIPAAAADYRAKGFGYVRLFYGYRPAYDMLGDGRLPPTKAQFARILDAAAAWIAEGFKVLLDCCDVLTTWEDLDQFAAYVYEHIRNCAGWIAERNFPRDMFAVGPVNEWGGDGDFLVYQVDFHRILRAALPGYMLICGSNGWKHFSRLIAMRPFVLDGRTIWDHHSYDAKSREEWEAVARQLETWSANNGGLVTMWTEAGLGYGGWYDANGQYYPGQEEDLDAWMQNIEAMFPAMQGQRPGFWAVTYGRFYRINNEGSALLRDGTDGGQNLAARLVALVQSIRAALGGGEAPGGGDPGANIVIPLPPELTGLFQGLDPYLTTNVIDLRQAVIAAQGNFNVMAGFLGGLVEALQEAVVELLMLHSFAHAKVAALEDANAAQAAELTSLRNTVTAARLSELPGPLTPAQVPLQVAPGGHYIDAEGLMRRRLT